jgi:uncharacterized metal-binding protein YceD (DUF177 family)
MKPVINEFSRLLPVDRVPNGGCYERLTAEPAECDAVAKRLGLPKIHALAALVRAQPWRDGLKMTGVVDADIDQVSVVSLEPFRSKVRHELERFFMPADSNVPEGEEIIDLIAGGEVDMGEIVVETLALELDPYPRREGEEFSPPEEEGAPIATSPFAKLAKLKQG